MNNPIYTNFFRINRKGTWTDPHFRSEYVVFEVQPEGAAVSFPMRVAQPVGRGLRRVDVLAALARMPWYAEVCARTQSAADAEDEQALAGSTLVEPVQPAGNARVAAHG